MKRSKAERYLLTGLLGAVLTLAGDLLIGAEKFPDGANLLDGYFSAALGMPEWRPVLGGLIGFLGISLEYCGFLAIGALIREGSPRGGRFYRLASHVYLAVGGGAVHLSCGVFMWIYKAVAGAAGTEAGREIALRYLLWFLLPATAVFTVFFAGANLIQFVAFLRGRTPFPGWYCVFNLVIGKVVFNGARLFGNTALWNGIGTSNMSLGAIVMFAALLAGWKKYVKDGDLSL